MNGLKSVSISASKRFRPCPPGTRGGTVSLRLSHSAVNSRPDVSRHGKDRPRPITPLDAKITGLTPLSIDTREGPIKRLLQAIDERDSSATWYYFQQVSNLGMANRLSTADFEGVLLSLRPKRYMSLQARHYLDGWGVGRINGREYAFKEFKRRLRIVTSEMRLNGHEMGTIEYTHLLDCARAGEDVKMAEDLWGQMMHTVGRRAVDTWCYNSYLAAVCGTISTEREHRMTGRTMMFRRKKHREDLRLKAHRIYNRMVRNGVHPNSMTFDLLILAHARVGDTAGVRKILRTVWGVDVKLLSENSHDLSFRPPACAKDSPMYPTQHTLAALAVAFGSNGDVTNAIRVIDHMSRRYNIRISMPAWVNLLNWTYVLTTRYIKYLPAHSVLDLWQIMCAEPYNVQPTIEMYDYAIRSLISRQYVVPAEDKMDEAFTLYSKLLEQVREAASAYRTAKPDVLTYPNIRQELAVAHRAAHRARSVIRRWVELLALGRGMNTDFTRRRVPDIVAKWRHFLGRRVVYFIDSGYVVLDLGDGDWAPLSIRRRKRKWWPLGTGAKEEDYLD